GNGRAGSRLGWGAGRVHRGLPGGDERGIAADVRVGVVVGGVAVQCQVFEDDVPRHAAAATAAEGNDGAGDLAEDATGVARATGRRGADAQGLQIVDPATLDRRPPTGAGFEG